MLFKQFVHFKFLYQKAVIYTIFADIQIITLKNRCFSLKNHGFWIK